MASDKDMRRFMAKTTPGRGGCVLWTGATLAGGYGQFSMYGKPLYAHRWIYEATVGPIPDGLHIDHLCRTRNCVNAGHMEPVTSAENTRRGEAGSNSRRKTHCPQGHPYSPDNTKLRRRPSGRIDRECRSCNRACSRRRREELRGAA